MRHRADGKLTCVEKGETLIQFIIKTIIMIRQSLSVSDLFCWTLFKACNDLLFFLFWSRARRLFTTNCKIPHVGGSWDAASKGIKTCEWISRAIWESEEKWNIELRPKNIKESGKLLLINLRPANL